MSGSFSWLESEHLVGPLNTGHYLGEARTGSLKKGHWVSKSFIRGKGGGEGGEGGGGRGRAQEKKLTRSEMWFSILSFCLK